MNTFTARKTGSDFALFVNGSNVPFGFLRDCEVCHIFESEDEELVDYIAGNIEGDMSLSEMLATVRTGYEACNADSAAIYESETFSENAWLRHSERYDAEAQADLELHNALN